MPAGNPEKQDWPKGWVLAQCSGSAESQLWLKEVRAREHSHEIYLLGSLQEDRLMRILGVLLCSQIENTSLRGRRAHCGCDGDVCLLWFQYDPNISLQGCIVLEAWSPVRQCEEALRGNSCNPSNWGD